MKDFDRELVENRLEDSFHKAMACGNLNEDTIQELFCSYFEKGAKANIGEIREWRGGRFKKQANGKWVEVSDKGKTKSEHLEESDRAWRNLGPYVPKDKYAKYEKRMNEHWSQYEKLSDKEYADDEMEESPKEKTKTFKLKDDKDMPISFWGLKGKVLESKGTKIVDFASGKQTYYIFDNNGRDVEVPERFLNKISDTKEKEVPKEEVKEAK